MRCDYCDPPLLNTPKPLILLEEFVSTATGVAEGIGALYGTQASNTEV
jgi:hypothetical protein